MCSNYCGMRQEAYGQTTADGAILLMVCTPGRQEPVIRALALFVLMTRSMAP